MISGFPVVFAFLAILAVVGACCAVSVTLTIAGNVAMACVPSLGRRRNALFLGCLLAILGGYAACAFALAINLTEFRDLFIAFMRYASLLDRVSNWQLTLLDATFSMWLLNLLLLTAAYAALLFDDLSRFLSRQRHSKDSPEL